MTRTQFPNDLPQLGTAPSHVCAECGAGAEIQESRKRSSRGAKRNYPFLWRRRRCSECGAVWTTYEVRAESMRHFQPSAATVGARSTHDLFGHFS